MQNQYVGDIGDYAKYSLLRALSGDRKIGISWYLHPDKGTNDGKHTKYLGEPEKWQCFDESTFKVLSDIVKSGKRNVSAIEKSDLLPLSTVFWSSNLNFQGCTRSDQRSWREEWFDKSLEHLKDCDLVFADPDNGLMKSENFRPGQRKHAKSISECEVHTLATGGRPVVIYHHNTRRRGGHAAEIQFWQRRLGEKTCAIRWRYISTRTFFICNCTEELSKLARSWCEKWDGEKVSFYPCPKRRS